MRSFVAFLVAGFISTAQASEVNDTKISQIGFNKQYGNFVFVKLEKSASRISCSTNGFWDYTLSLEGDIGKSIYSSLLAAYMAGKTVTVYGLSTPACNEFASVESISGLWVKN
ncbi:MAG TPA: hypothetical protein PKE57_00610 [Cellvibrionaceae bacterium]|jgi:hypothetical protein|nr:hypothetical protein [Cellvibrionaceae bacterium]HMW49284.1 hypothetical protein [Cellvibrionaceae bacterium]HMW71490.1 hypothetical protein [Cellvibrionaceae bacterium]HMY40506.1 hypothetical protein [Marinagarivorans sp.]